jgi:hypothetical protein
MGEACELIKIQKFWFFGPPYCHSQQEDAINLHTEADKSYVNEKINYCFNKSTELEDEFKNMEQQELFRPRLCLWLGIVLSRT